MSPSVHDLISSSDLHPRTLCCWELGFPATIFSGLGLQTVTLVGEAAVLPCEQFRWRRVLRSSQTSSSWTTASLPSWQVDLENVFCLRLLETFKMPLCSVFKAHVILTPYILSLVGILHWTGCSVRSLSRHRLRISFYDWHNLPYYHSIF